MATTSKSTASSKGGAKAPAKKATTKSVATSSEKKTVAKKKTATSTATKKNPVVKKAAAKPASTTAAKKAPVKKRSTAKLVAEKPTTKTVAKKKGNIKLMVKYDVGFGNSIFVRGDAPGLSWDKGTEMTNTAGDEWVWEVKRSTKAYELKVLINDKNWDAGENLVLKEQNITHYPTFQ